MIRLKRRLHVLGVAAAAAAVFALSASCKRENNDNKAADAAAVVLPPLPAPALTTSLAVPGFGNAVVALPKGTTKPAPVLVAVLGIGDNPDDQCATWREIVGTRGFVLCPRGAPHMVSDDDPANEDDDDNKDEIPDRNTGKVHQVGFYPIDVTSLDRELTAGLAALKARFNAYVDDRAIVYAGFSRGAFLGTSLAGKYPGRYQRVILIEGGQTAWHSTRATGFAKGGGKRVLFACGQPSCVDESQGAATILRQAKVDTRVVHGVGEGHGYRKQVKEELRRSFDWVTEGDPIWPRQPAVTK